MTDDGPARLPYPGLRAYRRDETDLFFGRDGCINEMVDRLGANRFLAVLGSSGSGKSSLVRTGLLDALELGFLAEAGTSWAIADCHPGSTPTRNLATALLSARGHQATDEFEVDALETFLRRGPLSITEWTEAGNLPKGQNLLVLVDQFEELFRYGDYAGREEAEALVALLLESASSTTSIYVVITMRSEYLGACALIRGLAERINATLYLTPRMSREETRQAIVGPAAVCKFQIASQLVNQLLNDLSSLAAWEEDRDRDQSQRLSRQADQLPLMQHVLNRMWLQASAASTPVTLTVADYSRVGGLTGALEAHAQEMLDSLAGECRPAVEKIFCALIAGTSINDAVRRPCRFDELVACAGRDEGVVRHILDTFRDSRCNFLIPPLAVRLEPSTMIDISHESLIRQWGALREWVQQEATSVTEYHQLQTRAEMWSRSRDRLLSGPALDDAVDWRKRYAPTAPWAARYGGDFALVTRFLDRSISLKRRHRWSTILGVLALFFFVSGGLVYGWYQSALLASQRAEEAIQRAAEAEAASSRGRLSSSLAVIAQATSDFGDEATDFHVMPQQTLQTMINSDTPLTIPGGTMITLRGLSDLYQRDPRVVLVDAWAGTDKHNTTLPTAIRIPFAGQSGSFEDETQTRLVARLSNLTEGDLSRPLVFFCLSSSCWESYNAALRAIRANFKNVYWLRGGNGAWRVSGRDWQDVNEEIMLAESRYKDDPSTLQQRWLAAVTLGELCRVLGASDGDRSLKSRSAEHSVEYMLSLHQDLKTDPAFLLDLSEALNRLGGLYSQDGIDASKAISAYGDEVSTRYESVDLAPNNYGTRLEYIVALTRLAEYHQRLGQENKYADMMRQASEAAPAVGSLVMSSRGPNLRLGDWYRDVAKALSGSGLPNEALTNLEQAKQSDAEWMNKEDAPDRDNAAIALWADYRSEADVYTSNAIKGEKNYSRYLNIAIQKYVAAIMDLKKITGDQPGWPNANLAIAQAHQAAAEIYNRLEYPQDRGDELLAALASATEARTAGNFDAAAVVNEVAQSLGGAADQFERHGAFGKALYLSERALAAAPEQEWINANLAHALMFLGHTEEARQIYLRYLGRTTNGLVWNDALLSDFAEFRHLGHNVPLMEEIQFKLPQPKPN